jgi:iron complex outermembrane receptor protein
MKQFFVILTYLCLNGIAVAAQKECNEITITILEQHTKQPVADVVVYIPQLNEQIITNDEGGCVLASLCPGDYTFKLHSYEIQDTVIQLTIKESTHIRLFVHHNIQLLKQVEVIKKVERDDMQIQTQVEEATVRSLKSNSLATILEQVSGVSTLKNGNQLDKTMIHGLHSNRIVTINNGVRQEEQQWGVEHTSNIDPLANEKFTVIKGAAGVKYGNDAIGGVVVVDQNPIRSAKGWGGKHFVGYHANGRMPIIASMLEHRFAKNENWAFRVQGATKKAGNYQLADGRFVANSGVKQYSFSTLLEHHKHHSTWSLYYSHYYNTIGVYSGSHIGSEHDLNRAIFSDTPLVMSTFSYDIDRPKQLVHHQILKLKYAYDSKIGLFQTQYAFQNNKRKEFDVIRIENGKAQLNLSLNTHQFNTFFEHKKWNRFSGQVGIDAQYQHNTFQNGDRVFIPTYFSYSTGIYGYERYALKSIAIEAGFRYEIKKFDMYNSEGLPLRNVHYSFLYSNPSFTLSAQKKFKHHTKWITTISSAWRAPNANELFSAGLHLGGARIELGDKNLKPEQSMSLSTELNTIIAQKIQLKINLYNQWIQDFIYLEPGDLITTIRGVYKTYNYKSTNARLSGVDMNLQYQWNDWISTFGASVLYAKDALKNDWLIMMPSNRYTFGLKYKKQIIATNTEIYLGANLKYVDQQKRIPRNFIDLDPLFPPRAYYTCGANLGINTSLGSKTINFEVNAYNILNQSYREYLDVWRYYLSQPGRSINLSATLIF